jgi:hypothetical protein
MHRWGIRSATDHQTTVPPFDWVYHVTQTTSNTVRAIEYHRISNSGIIQTTRPHEVTLSSEGFQPIRVLM